MRILLIVILLSFMTGCLSCFKVTGYSGGTVIIYCHYSIEDRSHEKYFCKGPKWTSSCDKNITTLRKNTWQHSGRFSLYDNTGGNYFKVIIRQLTRQDDGTYWCGVDKPNIPDSYTEVELNVKKDDCCEKSVTETAYLGEATIRCNYSEDHEYRTKYFCKESNDFKTCVDMISAYQTTATAGCFSVSCNTGEKFYTVTISDLTERNTGTYWCGVATSHISLITQVQLQVTDWRDVKQINVTEQFGETARLTCKYPADHKKNEKFFCKGDSPVTCEDKVRTAVQNQVVYKGRFSLRDNPRKTVFTVHIKELRPEDSGTYWCGSDRRWRPADYTRCILSVVAPTITTTTTTALPAPTTTTSISPSSSFNVSGTSVVIMVSVSLVVLLLGISLITVYRWKYKKVTGSVSSTHRLSPDTGNNEGGCHGDGDYEEIKERPLRSDSGAVTTTIYATANLPTSHSDSPHYATVNFHKNSNGPNEPTATITKEGTSSCDYATGTFCHSPAYSTVNHPHSSSEAPPIYSTVSKPRDT